MFKHKDQLPMLRPAGRPTVARVNIIRETVVMTDHPYFPIRGLSLAEWQAALRAVEAVLPQIDNRLMSAKVLKDGSIEIKTGEVAGGLVYCATINRT
jgi:hypothetical protein